MVSTLTELFETYRNSDLYDENSVEINFNWLIGKINKQDISEIESQAAKLLLDNEKEVFIHGFQFAWNLFQDLSCKSADDFSLIKNLHGFSTM